MREGGRSGRSGGVQQGGGFPELYNEYAAGGSYDTGEAMLSRNGITVCGFVNSLQDGYAHCRQLSALSGSLGSVKPGLAPFSWLGPTVTSQIPYRKTHSSCL